MRTSDANGVGSLPQAGGIADDDYDVWVEDSDYDVWVEDSDYQH